MKKFGILLLFMTFCYCLDEDEEGRLSALSDSLYELEDKIDHLLYHNGHDVTTHEVIRNKHGAFWKFKPKNPNSLHQKLKKIDLMSDPSISVGIVTPRSYDNYIKNLKRPTMPILHPSKISLATHYNNHRVI